MGSRDILAPRWDCICGPAKDRDLKLWGTSCAVQLLFELPFPVYSAASIVDTVGCSECDSPGMVGIVVRLPSVLSTCRTLHDTDLGACDPAAVCTRDDLDHHSDVSRTPDLVLER